MYTDEIKDLGNKNFYVTSFDNSIITCCVTCTFCNFTQQLKFFG